MKKCIFIILFSLSAWAVFSPSLPSYAFDKGGCLTCHKYPGLVKYEKPDTVSVLHIDEDKHLASPHGETDCKQCHPKTTEVPHTGVNEVDCTSTCHLKDMNKINNLGVSYLKEYHKDEKFAITKLEDKTSCRVCHPLYPHSANRKVRALLNMHTGFMLCEVCHLKKDSLNNLTYGWNKPEEFEFIGEPYGMHEKKEIKETRKSGNIIAKMLRIQSEDAEQKKTHIKHLISRIAVFKVENDKKSLFVNTQDNEKARSFLDIEKKLTKAEQEKELNFFHEHIAKKEISVACNECHAADSMLNFRKLGFSEKKARDLRYLNIKSLVTKYETFYFPNLFGPKE